MKYLAQFILAWVMACSTVREDPEVSARNAAKARCIMDSFTESGGVGED